jgi:hypothetical protein
MMSTLRSNLNDLASAFASSVFDAIKGASLDELLGETGAAPRRGPGRPKATPSPQTNGKPAPVPRSGRLSRRSPEEIAKALEGVVALVRKHKHKEGLRAEEIRANLGMEAKEMPRVLKEGLSTKKLRAKGQKRATTYTAA